jgi:ribosomal protein L32
LQAQSVVADDETPLFPEGLKKKGQKRRHKSRAVVQLQNCTICGSADHKRNTCDQKGLVTVDSKCLKALALQKVKKLAAVVARLKYTPLHQRTSAYNKRPLQRSRAEVHRGFVELSRMDPEELTNALIEDGLLPELDGAPCPNVKCEQQSKGYGKVRGMGKLCKAKVTDKTLDMLCIRNVWHRCMSCRCRIPVTRGVPLFEGATWPSLALLAYWNCVEGVDMTACVRQLKVSEELVRRWYHTARVIMAEDALKRQESIVFGRPGSETTDIEADESSFFSWSEIDPETKERVYRWYVWLGVVERGNLASLWLSPVGITTSRGEPRMPPLKNDKWLAVCNQIFRDDTKAVLMTDSAGAYREVQHPGIVEKHKVNHSEHEYSRSVDILRDISTGHRRPGMAGTQFLDHEWRLLKEDKPVTGLSARTEQNRQNFDLYVRAAQWKRMIATGDRWPEWCRAAEDLGV